MSVSLYVHIPFCLKRCIYCDFVSGIYDSGKANAYIAALKKEIDAVAAKAAISTLYIGGGTPTALSTDALSDLIRHIFTHISLTPSDDIEGKEGNEATIEANPGTVDRVKLQAVRSLGINRTSIGVQSFDNSELDLLGRIHSSEEAEQAVYFAREAGFDNISIDLIYGIPGQTPASWEKTLEKAVSLGPEHISTYELTVEEGTALHELLKNPPSSLFIKGGINPPAEETTIEMYEHTIAYLASHGYVHYEISNFARPGHFCRHNLNYWDRGEYYGAGLGAHSHVEGKRYYNTDRLDEYIQALSADKSPVKETEYITGDKALSEAVFLGLRRIDGLNIEHFSKRYKVDLLTRFEKEIREFQEAGLVEIVDINGLNSLSGLNRSLRLTRKGLLLSNEVFAGFL